MLSLKIWIILDYLENKFNSMSILKRHLDEQIQLKNTQKAHENYQQKQYETQVLDDVKKYKQQEEKLKQKKVS